MWATHQYILALWGSARRKNAIFLLKIFQKVAKNAFLARFFKILPKAQKI